MNRLPPINICTLESLQEWRDSFPEAWITLRATIVAYRMSKTELLWHWEIRESEGVFDVSPREDHITLWTQNHYNIQEDANDRDIWLVYDSRWQVDTRILRENVKVWCVYENVQNDSFSLRPVVVNGKFFDKEMIDSILKKLFRLQIFIKCYNTNLSIQHRLKIHPDSCESIESSEVQYLFDHVFREYEIMCIWRLVDAYQDNTKIEEGYEIKEVWSLHNILFDIKKLNCFNKKDIQKDIQKDIDTLTSIRLEIKQLRHEEIAHIDGKRMEQQVVIKGGGCIVMYMEKIQDPLWKMRTITEIMIKWIEKLTQSEWGIEPPRTWDRDIFYTLSYE